MWNKRAKKTRRIQLIKLSLILMLISTFAIVLLISNFFIEEITFNVAVTLSLLSTLFSLLLIYYSEKIMTLGITSVLFLYFTITHFGATTIYSINPESIYTNFRTHQYVWLSSDNITAAILYSILGQIAFILSSEFFFNGKLNPKNNNTKKSLNRSIWLPRIGLIFLYSVTLYFIFNILTGAISLTSSYSNFIEWRLESVFFTYAIYLLATGFIFVISSGTISQIKHGLIVYLVISVILLLTGNKGEVLYAILTGVGVYYSRGKKIPKRLYIIGVLVFFVILPFVTETRSGSILNSLDQLKVDITGPFIEIGWQMRTVERVISWIKNGENYLFGVSYIAPIQRIISSFTLGLIPRIPISDVPWAFGERLPGWGFSQVAESYYNFSIFGPILFYSIQGAFTKIAENESRNVYKKAFYSSIAVILMILNRNRFTFVPGQILMSLIIVLVGFMLDRNLYKYKSTK